MDPEIYILALITFASTLIGGIAALRMRKNMRYFFAFSAGTMIAVVFFDILPESLLVAESIRLPIRYLMIVLVGIFLTYSVIDRYFLTHQLQDAKTHAHIMGPIGAGGLIVHSFFDGIAIGAGFQVSASVGIIIALAIILHDFTDGINTVTLMLKNNQKIRRANLFLATDALAPIAGVFVAGYILISSVVLAFILAAFCGEFLYIGATNLLPETYKHNSLKMAIFMALGIALIFALTSII
jgi:zinc transporter ZupT